MRPIKSPLLSSTVVPAMVLAAGLLAARDTTAGATAKANIVAAGKTPCNPCAAKNPCNPCAAKANPCAAKRNPCNPCAAQGGGPSAKCVVPRLRTAAANPCAAKNPCTPCAAKRNPCNPCAAKANPCAAKNPCNPCAAKNPCNPCGAGTAPELTKAEAVALYNCLKGEMRAAYGKSGNRHARAYARWAVFNTRPYVSATHGGRLVNNYANAKARNYGKFEKSGRMPAGAVLAKNSFTVAQNGRAGVGPLFLMEKMPRGFSKESQDWRYTLIMPTGAVVGTTNGRGANNVKFCIECHVAVAEDQDSMMFMPEEVRLQR